MSAASGRPLAEASERLRRNPPPGFPGLPGRPGKGILSPPGDENHQEIASTKRKTIPGTAEALAKQRIDVSVAPRVIDLKTTAAYLAVSQWTVRDLEASGVLRRIRVPLPNGRELRKVLFDRADLDRLIERWKDLAP